MSLAIAPSANSRYSSVSDEVRLTPHERVTAQISSLLERGIRPWIKPWDDIAPPDAWFCLCVHAGHPTGA